MLQQALFIPTCVPRSLSQTFLCSDKLLTCCGPEGAGFGFSRENHRIVATCEVKLACLANRWEFCLAPKTIVFGKTHAQNFVVSFCELRHIPDLSSSLEVRSIFVNEIDQFPSSARGHFALFSFIGRSRREEEQHQGGRARESHSYNPDLICGRSKKSTTSDGWTLSGYTTSDLIQL